MNVCVVWMVWSGVVQSRIACLGGLNRDINLTMEWRVKPEPSVATVRMKPVVIAAACLESKTQEAAMARARTAYRYSSM